MPEQQPQSFGQLVSSIDNNMAMLLDVLAKAGVNPEVAQGFASLQDQFRGAIEKLQGGGDEGQEMAPKNPEGAASPEAGGAEVMPM